MAKNIKQRNVSQKKKTDTNNGPLETTRRMNSASHMTVHQRRLAEDKQEREKLVLWRHPISTLHYFLLETGCLLYSCAVNLWQKRRTVIFILLTFLALVFVYNVEGFHQKMIKVLRKKILWCVYWVGLGILSSVGLGTGLHTFVLYLGPHIASVTLAAFECMSLDFPEPPYPDKIICPENISPVMSIWMIMSKVRLEAIMWGAGTAIGELPPYFMARAARLSGSDLEDEEFEELEELLKEKTAHPEELSFLEKLKVGIHNLIKKVGFFGILACASIPNPLFDLAGITCGHFLIPFWTFFGASLIGKAIIKMHIQKLFVIILFSQHHAEQLVDLIRVIPFVGQSMQKPFDNWLKEQKNKLHHKPDTDLPENTNLLSRLFEKVIIVMVVYFVLSIINSMAQSYHKRLCKMWRQDE